MAITTLSMVLTVFILNLHGIADRPVPSYVRILVLVHLAKLFCMSQQLPEVNKTNDLKMTTPPVNATATKKKKRTSRPIIEDEGDENQPIIALNGSLSSTNGAAGQETSFMQELNNHSYANRPQVFECINAGNNQEPSYLSELDELPNEEEDYSKDWHRLAEVVDRLFFWTFLIAIIAISILLFHPLGKEVLSSRPQHVESR